MKNQQSPREGFPRCEKEMCRSFSGHPYMAILGQVSGAFTAFVWE